MKLLPSILYETTKPETITAQYSTTCAVLPIDRRKDEYLMYTSVGHADTALQNNPSVQVVRSLLECLWTA